MKLGPVAKLCVALAFPLVALAQKPINKTAAPNSSVHILRFDVATIKPSKSGMMGTHVYPGGRVLIQSLPLKTLIKIAYNVSFWQISGGDPWMEQTAYNIEAKPPHDDPSIQYDTGYGLFQIKDPRLCEMLQTLLVERFHLAIHHETKQGAVSLLMRNDKPLQLHAVKDKNLPSEISLMGGGQWLFFNVSMPDLAQFTSTYVVHHPVLDRTGLVGTFDYKTPDNELDPSGALPTTADSFPEMLEEIGFKLESSKGPVEKLIIDHAEPPTPN